MKNSTLKIKQSNLLRGLLNSEKDPPDLIKQGNRADTLMFHKFFSETIVSPKYLVLVIKYLNTKGLVPTGYFTERILNEKLSKGSKTTPSSRKVGPTSSSLRAAIITVPSELPTFFISKPQCESSAEAKTLMND